MKKSPAPRPVQDSSCVGGLAGPGGTEADSGRPSRPPASLRGDSWRTVYGNHGRHQNMALVSCRLTNVAADKHFSDAASPQWLYCACC